ncbi:MAG: M15 family metallopeptidase [Clostridia bacterium]|nr:M15 family metallopeptidase [Clostridia bacterium]
MQTIKEQQKQSTLDPSGFVLLSEFVPDVLQEIRYYTAYNFVGERIDGYEEPCAILTREAAAALKRASDECRFQGYRLKVFDAYRPARAVAHFVRWASDVSDERMKSVFYPDLDKRDLFEKGYISEKSGHSRGSAVDLTLLFEETGEALDMGGSFDLLNEISHPDYRGITEEQYENRMLLRRIMTRNGFQPIDCEWWHFYLSDEPYPDTYFDFPVSSAYLKEYASR